MLPEHHYEFILCESPSITAPFAPLVKLGDLRDAKNRTWNPVKNRAGSASFSLRTSDDMVAEIMDHVDLNDVRGTVRKCLRVVRDEVDMWSGPIWGITGDLSSDNITFNCVGWLEETQHRILWSTADYSNSGAGTPSDHIAFDLLTRVNAQDTAHPLLIRPGSVIGTLQVRNRYYTRGQNLGAALQELSDIEAGYDYEVDPVTRDLNLSAWDSFVDQTNIKLGYNCEAKNLKNVTWQEDAGRTCNYMEIQSLGAPVVVVDTSSQDEYNLFEELDTLTGANQSILVPYGEAELVIRSRPLVTYTLVPDFRLGGKGPKLFDDFQLGDKVYFSAVKNHFKVTNQAVRVFGATIQVDDNGNENITALQTAPTG